MKHITKLIAVVLVIVMVTIAAIPVLVGAEGYNLTVSSTPGGNATTLEEGNFTRFDAGTVVNLVATPNNGYRFVNWTANTTVIFGNATAAATNFTMLAQNVAVTANFVAYYVLNISSTAGGNVITPREGLSAYDNSTAVNLMAKANKCYEFINWTGNVTTVDNPTASSTSINMSGNYSIRANFARLSYNLTVNSALGGNVAAPGEGTVTYNCSNVVYLVAEANEGYRFVEWTGNVTAIAEVYAASTNITMNGNYSITANFIAQYNLTIDSTGSGKVTTPGEGTFTYDTGMVVGLVAPPDAGYYFVAWTGDVGTIGNVEAAATSIVMNGDYSIMANFKSVRTPATFEYDDLRIVPEVATAGENITVTLRVDNTGDVADVYRLILAVDGTTVQTKDGSLNGGRHERVVIAFAAGSKPGVHTVTVGGLSGNYTIKTPPVSGGINWWLLIAILVAACVVVFILFSGTRKGAVGFLSSLKAKFVKKPEKPAPKIVQSKSKGGKK